MATAIKVTDTKTFSEKGAYAGQGFVHEVLNIDDVKALATDNPALVEHLLMSQLVQHQFSSAARCVIDGKELKEGGMVYQDTDGVFCLNRGYKPGTRVAGGADKAKAYENRLAGAIAGVEAAGVEMTETIMEKLKAKIRAEIYG